MSSSELTDEVEGESVELPLLLLLFVDMSRFGMSFLRRGAIGESRLSAFLMWSTCLVSLGEGACLLALKMDLRMPDELEVGLFLGVGLKADSATCW